MKEIRVGKCREWQPEPIKKIQQKKKYSHWLAKSAPVEAVKNTG